MSNLRFLNKTTFSGVASASTTDLFTSDFQVYKIVFSNYQQTSGTAGRGRLRFINSSGSVDSTSTYNHASLAIESPTSSSFPEVKSTTNKFIDFMLFDNGETGAASSGVMYVFNPFESSNFTYVTFQEGHFQNGFGASSEKGIGVLKSQSSMTGINIHGANSGSFNLTVKTYGLRIDS